MENLYKYNLSCDTDVGELSCEVPSNNILDLNIPEHKIALEAFIKNACECARMIYKGNVKLELLEDI